MGDLERRASGAGPGAQLGGGRTLRVPRVLHPASQPCWQLSPERARGREEMEGEGRGHGKTALKKGRGREQMQESIKEKTSGCVDRAQHQLGLPEALVQLQK